MSLSNFNIPKLDDAINSSISTGMAVLDTILSSNIITECSEFEVESIGNSNFSNISPAMYMNIVFSGDVQGKAAAFFRVIDLSVIISYLMGTDKSDTEFDEMTLGMLNEIMVQVFSDFSKELSAKLGINAEVSVSGLMEFSDYSVISSLFECSSDDEAMLKNFNYEISSIVKGRGLFCFSELFIRSLCRSAGIDEAVPQSSSQNTSANDSYSDNLEIQQPVFPKFSVEDNTDTSSVFVGKNMDLLMDVPVNVCVEIGKTKRKMKEVMNYSQGSVIMLEKRAGDPVDITINGQIIARGDVIVIDNNFGVRITEIVNSKEITGK